MGVLDRQSLRGAVRNRRLGRSRLELRDRRTGARTDSGERRRPERGLHGTSARRPKSPHGLQHHILHALARGSDVGYAVARGALSLLLLPFLFLSLLGRPRELVRRLIEMPARLRATSKRFRLESRDPDTTAGRIASTSRVSMWFLREELADMRDGIPRARAVREDLRSGGRSVLDGVAGFLGLQQAADGIPVGERLADALRMGLVLGVLAVGLFVATYNGFEELKRSDGLALQQITVTGLDRVTEQEVLARLGAQIGDNLLEIEPATLALAVQTMPWVSSVEVLRDLASRSVAVRVIERRPLLLLAGPRLRFVDERGQAFKERETGESGDLPLLVGVPHDATGLPDPVALAEATVGAVEVLRALDGGRVLNPASISEIVWSRAAGWAIVTRAGLPVHLGQRDFAQRLRRVEQAVGSGQLPLHAIASIDTGLRDRLVAVPLAQTTARKAVEQVVSAQAVPTRDRARLLHLKRVELDLDPVSFDDTDAVHL